MHADKGSAASFFFILSAWLVAVVISSSAFPSAPAQVPERARYVFQTVGEDLGLATITPTCLYQDRQGFIWIGTSSGLLRYDGSRLLKYGPGQGLPVTTILQIGQTPDGRMLVGTHRGLAVEESGSFRFLSLPEDVSRLSSRQPFAVQPSGRIFIATSRGLWILDGTDKPQGVLWSKEHGIAGEHVEAVYSGPDGKVWLASGSQLGWVDAEMHLHMLAAHETSSTDPILSLAEDGKGRVWLRTARQLFRLEADRNRPAQDTLALPPMSDVGALAIDIQGHLMIPTVAGLYLHRETHWVVLDKRRGLGTNSVISAIQDREGSYWIGLGGSGIQRWQGDRTWSGWTDAEGIPDNVVWSELRDAQQRLWIGTNNGVAFWDTGLHDFRVWKTREGLNGSVAREMALAPDGSIWVLCHPGGLTRIDPASYHLEKVSVPAPEPVAIGRGPDGRIWLAAPHSLRALRATHAPFAFDDVTVPPEVLAAINNFASASSNVLWANGPGGLARYDGKNWTLYTRKDGLLSNAVVEVVSVRPDEAWVRYSDAPGVSRFRLRNGATEAKHFASAQGLPSDAVYMLGLDRAGNAWVGGDKGITEITPKETMQHYRHSDGLLWDDVSEGGFYAESDGTLLFGTSGGLARFDPQGESTLPPVTPNVVITSAQLGEHERVSELHPRAGHEENTLYAEFAVLSYRDPASVRCSYRLNGLEDKTVDTGVREIRYPALGPGKYDLEVGCQSTAGAAGVPAHFGFKVLPAWWQEWWARALGLMLVALSIYAICVLRIYSLNKDRQRLELAVAERGAQLEHANQELREASLTDPLTGARNRRFFQLTIEADIGQAIRAYAAEDEDAGVRNRDLIFYLIDADYFKEVNDAHGHSAGDELLAEMTRRIQSAVRMSDALVRWGGEEFLVVSRASNRTEATALASRILHSIADRPFRLLSSSQPLHKTCSIGWAPFPWFPAAPKLVDYETVVALADQALYKAKQTGRNRAVGVLPVDDKGIPEGSLVGKSVKVEELKTFLITTLGPRAAQTAASGS